MISSYDNAYRDEERLLEKLRQERLSEIAPVIDSVMDEIQSIADRLSAVGLDVQVGLVRNLERSLADELMAAREEI